MQRRKSMSATNHPDPFPTLRRPDGKIIDNAKVRLGDGFISAEFPPLRRPDETVADSGKVRLGDGFITAEYPPKK
jgi:hypothetical protein